MSVQLRILCTKYLQDNNIKILRINTHWLHSDLERSLRAKSKKNYVHFSCTEEQKEFLVKHLKDSIIFLEDDGKLIGNKKQQAVGKESACVGNG